MAPFRPGDELQHELPWVLMQNGYVTLYWKREGFEEDIEELRTRGYRVARFDCETWRKKWRSDEKMHDQLKTGFGLPDYYGGNFNALRDSMEDIEVPEHGGLVVALDNFVKSEQNEALLGALADVSRWWLLFGRIVPILVRTDDNEYVGPAALGGMSAWWNGREWFNADRGL